MILSHARFPVSHPGIFFQYGRRDSNPQKPMTETGTYSVPSLPHKCPWWDSNSQQWTIVRHGFWTRRIFQFCYRGITVWCTPGGIWTLTEPGLSRIPLPVGTREQIVGRAGLEPAMFTTRVTDLQSAGFANSPYRPINKKPPAWKYSRQAYNQIDFTRSSVKPVFCQRILTRQSNLAAGEQKGQIQSVWAEQSKHSLHLSKTSKPFFQ